MPPLKGNPSEFHDETYVTKTRGRELPHGETFMIVTSTVFDLSTRVTDGQTDEQMGDSIYRAKHISYML